VTLIATYSMIDKKPRAVSLRRDVYVGGKVRVSEFMIFLTLQHNGSK